MFPVRDELGRVVGFSGRILTPKKNTGKYVNSPETLVFRKSRLLYAILFPLACGILTRKTP